MARLLAFAFAAALALAAAAKANADVSPVIIADTVDAQAVPQPKPHHHHHSARPKKQSPKSHVTKDHLKSVPWPSSNVLNRDPFGANEFPTMTDLAFESKKALVRNEHEAPPPLAAQCLEPDGGDGPIRMAMLVPSSTNGLGQVQLKDLPLVKFFIPSFKKTTEVSKRFEFHLYLGYDRGDPFYDNQGNLDALRTWITQNCGMTAAQLHFMKLEKAKLVHLWNQLFDQAYADGMHYFYQVGDDIEHKTVGWADAFVDTLRRNPVARNFGVVGPSDCKLRVPWVEQAVVARIHRRIVGTLFDPQFIDASCDVWLSQTYGITNSYYLTDVQVWNVLRTTRYKARPGTSIMEERVRRGRHRACAWLSQCTPNAKLTCDMLRQDSITIAFKSLRPDTDRRGAMMNMVAQRYSLRNRLGQSTSVNDLRVCQRARSSVSSLVRRILYQ